MPIQNDFRRSYVKTCLQFKGSYHLRVLAILLCLMVLVSNTIFSQTLTKGDISIIGFNSALASRDGFSFVSWVNIPTGTVIKFTDGGFNSSSLATTSGNFRDQEQTITWTTTSPINPGTVITIEGNGNILTPATITNTGTVSVVNASGTSASLMALTNGGDQLFAFQGSFSNSNTTTATLSGTPLFLLSFQGIGANSTWAAGPATSASSALPSDLASQSIFLASNAVAAEYTGARSGKTIAEYKTLISNPANWTVYTNPNGVNTYNTASFATSTTLPITLSSFTATSESGKVVLQWQSATEENSRLFVVQRSLDGTKWEDLSTVQAAGQSTQEKAYRFEDRLNHNSAYYRLKMVDIDGKYSFSEIRKVAQNENSSVKIYPNPVVGSNFTVELNAAPTAALSYKLIDAAGSVIAKGQLRNKVEKIELSSLLPGSYFLQLSNGELLKLQKK